MMDNPDELSLQALVRVLASGSLDSRPSTFRANFVEHATLLISESHEARSDLASGANNLNGESTTRFLQYTFVRVST